MGLDTVELVMTLEDHFAIRIPDRDAEELCTVGQIYEYLERRLNVPELRRAEIRCASRATFYQLRYAVMDCLGLPRRVIRPCLSLTDVLPVRELRRIWPNLQLAAGLRLPALDPFDDSAKKIVGAAALLMMVTAPLTSWATLGNAGVGFVFVFFCLFAAGWVIARNRPDALFRIRADATMRDLAVAVMCIN